LTKRQQKERHVSKAKETSTLEDDVKTRAYSIWEEEGKPEGKHLEHWRRATQEIGDQAPPTAAAQPATKRDVKGKV
jgi:hypothetical protein